MIQVINRAVDILLILSKEPDKPIPLSEISQELKIHQATCANILRTLVDRNFVEQVGSKKGYILGPMAYYLAKNGPYRKDIVLIADPLIAKLARDLQETVLVLTMQHGRRFILCQVDGNQVFQIRHDVLALDDIYSTATGRLLLSYLTPKELDICIFKKGLPKEAWKGVETKEKLISALSKIRKHGRVVYEKTQLAAIAFPIKEDDKVIAALGLYLSDTRFKGVHKDKVMKGMKKTADEISANLLRR